MGPIIRDLGGMGTVGLRLEKTCWGGALPIAWEIINGY
jgi:hypothetical protein